jgi:hypothetical protein
MMKLKGSRRVGAGANCQGVLGKVEDAFKGRGTRGKGQRQVIGGWDAFRACREICGDNVDGVNRVGSIKPRG